MFTLRKMLIKYEMIYVVFILLVFGKGSYSERTSSLENIHNARPRKVFRGSAQGPVNEVHDRRIVIAIDDLFSTVGDDDITSIGDDDTTNAPDSSHIEGTSHDFGDDDITSIGDDDITSIGDDDMNDLDSLNDATKDDKVNSTFADSASFDGTDKYHDYKPDSSNANGHDVLNISSRNNTAWHESVKIPYIDKDTLLHDAFLGAMFAFVITMVVVTLGLFVSWCCCPDTCNHRRWMNRPLTRKRYRIEESGKYAAYFRPLRQSDSGNSDDLSSNDSWVSDETDDTDKLEYGETERDFNDDGDYNIASKCKGRYEEEEVQNAAVQYFSEERIQNFFNHSFSDSDSDSEGSDTPLDLVMIEKKIITSMNKE